MTVDIVMMLVIAILGTAPLIILVYFLLKPRHAHITSPTQDGGGRTIGGGKIAVAPPPDTYEVNGSDHVEPYVVRLLESGGSSALLRMFTPDGKRGFEIYRGDRVIKAGLMIDWRKEPEREAAIRAFFDSLSIEPIYDYLSGIRNATRFLSYPIQGDASTITNLAKRILEELCGIAPEQALNIQYSDRSPSSR